MIASIRAMPSLLIQGSRPTVASKLVLADPSRGLPKPRPGAESLSKNERVALGLEAPEPTTVTATVTAFGPEGPPPKPLTSFGKKTTKSVGATAMQQPAASAASQASSGPVVEASFERGASGGGGGAPDREGASFTAVSGEVPDGVVYVIVAAAIAAAGFLLYRRTKGRS